MIDGVGLIARVTGVFGGLMIALAAIEVMGAVDKWLERLILAAGALVVLCHAQIEMTCWHPGSVVFALLLLGLAAAGPRGGARLNGTIAAEEATVTKTRAPMIWRVLGFLPAASMLFLASSLAAYGWTQAVRLEADSKVR